MDHIPWYKTMNLFHKKTSDNEGFTLIEIIAVLIILGIISAVIISRSSNMDASLYSEAEAIKTHLRYAQTQAMNKTTPTSATPVLVWGMKCDSISYWLFQDINPDDTTKIRVLPDNAAGSDNKVLLATKKVGLSTFTVFFDERGIPYSAYTDANTNTPLAAAQTITVTSPGSSQTITISITPLTGFIP